MKKLYCTIFGEGRKYEKPKISYLLEKHYFFLLFAATAGMKIKNHLKKKNQLRYQKLLFNWKYMVTLKIWLKKT